MFFPISRFNEILDRAGDFRLLEKIPDFSSSTKFPIQLREAVGDECLITIVDFETLGLDAEIDPIIEIGLVEISYSQSKMMVTSINKVTSEYEDPKKPIPEFIEILTGITYEQVIGKKISEETMDSYFNQNQLVVAHNANFDRAFFDKRFPGRKDLRWACSINGIDWRGLGIESRKLDYILLKMGWFFDGHRASSDCLAVAWFLHKKPESLSMLIESSNAETVIVRAFGAPFDIKDTLKARGYQWHDGAKGHDKHWYNEVRDFEKSIEEDFLIDLYDNLHLAQYETINATNRFK